MEEEARLESEAQMSGDSHEIDPMKQLETNIDNLSGERERERKGGTARGREGQRGGERGRERGR